MKIYIPSYRRYNAVQSGTLRWIPKGMLKDTVLAVRPEELEWYEKFLKHEREYGLGILVLNNVTGISDTRQQIGIAAASMGEPGFITMDDDLSLMIRKSDDVWNLRPCDPPDVIDMKIAMERLLNDYAQVAISLRQGNNNVGTGPSPLLQENGRAIRVCAFRTHEFNLCVHNRVPVMEDIDVTLQLLDAGYKNAILYYWANDQRQTNAPGGCSTWRTHEVHETSARRMCELWPGICTLRDKTNKTGGEFGSRKEITVQWKKAYRPQ